MSSSLVGYVSHSVVCATKEAAYSKWQTRLSSPHLHSCPVHSTSFMITRVHCYTNGHMRAQKRKFREPNETTISTYRLAGRVRTPFSPLNMPDFRTIELLFYKSAVDSGVSQGDVDRVRILTFLQTDDDEAAAHRISSDNGV